MILAIVVDTEGNDGACFELAGAEPVAGTVSLEVAGFRQAPVLEVREKVGEFPFSGRMLAAMIGLDVPAPPR